ERPAPPMRDRRSRPQRREQVHQRRRELVMNACIPVEGGVHAGPKVIRSAAAAEGQPVVRRSLPVNDHAPQVRERLSLRARPAWAQNDSGSGSVATINEYSGASSLPWPGSADVYPSVARTTTGARTVPAAVSTVPGRRFSAGVCT